MKKIRKMLKSIPKINYVIGFLAIVLVVSFMLPSLARYENRIPTPNTSVWSGNVASGYRKGNGTIDDPYVIANGEELAYFAEMLKTTDYENTYFVLSNDIVLNNGVFGFDETNGMTYQLSNSLFYLKEYTNEFYDNVNRENTKIGNINLFSSLDNFKGHFDGQFYTIYGLYISSEDENVALFTNLSGEVSNLYVDNAMIYGGSKTAGIASNSNDSQLNNILYNGYVIGTNIKTETKEISIPSQNVTVNNQTIDIPLSSIDNVTSTTLSGTVSDSGTIMINGNQVSGDFTLELGSNLIDELIITYNSSEMTNFTISNLKYIINYESSKTAGIIADATNTSLNNIINKGTIYGKMDTSGIIADASEVTINNTYNSGTINGNNAAGIVTKIIDNVDPITINNTYNSGIINGNNTAGLINSIKNSTVTISNTFDTQSSFVINNIENASVNINNSYAVTTTPINGINPTDFITTTLTELTDKNYVINNLQFNEFVDYTDLNINSDNVWIYEDDNLPILYIDDIKNPIANIHVGTYTWNNLGISSNLVKFNSSITFSIEQVDNLRPLKEISYYIHNSKTPLTKDEIEVITWTNYENMTQINEEGFYIIYAKVVDYNDNITYLNTDTLVLDKSSPNVSISLNNSTWNNLRSDLNHLYINQTTDYNITAVDDLSGVASIEYYITDEVLTSEQLNNVTWASYTENLNINTLGNYIIYAKVTDNCGFISYANSDYIVYNGYNLNSLKSGYSQDDANYINNLSSVTLNFTYSDDNSLKQGETHNIISNVLLPVNTKITLIDNVNKKIYTYKTTGDNYGYDTSCESNECKYATYPFTMFKEVGKSTDSYFVETLNSINENYTINFDFSESIITNNYENISLTLAIKNGVILRDTLNSSKKTFNIIANVDGNPTIATLDISSDYSNQPIQYNSNSTTEINITTGLNYSTINNNKIFDTFNEDKTIGLAIKLVDSENNIIPKQKLKNLRFKIGEQEYSPDDDGIVRINLNNGLNLTTTTLVITTYEDEASLAIGNYSLVINSYLAYDGMYTNNYSNQSITIPVNVSNNYVESNYNFDVLFDNNYKILKKADGNVTLDLDLLQSGTTNGSIRISLYKKSQLTAYNQDYTIIDLANYITDLEKVKENVYYLIKNPVEYNGTSESINNFKLNFNPTNLENGGYKFVFELFNGDQKVGTIEKKFIVR